jgi:[phosphatase 2A protein]-leucine-carboxy methyltransferase
MSSDEAIQLTNNDASTFKAYAVSKGYWTDPYISYFAPSVFKQASSSSMSLSSSTIPPSSSSHSSEHKPPEMSRGYFARVNAIRTVVNKFLGQFASRECEGAKVPCQIVNLGAGYDTLYLNLIDGGLVPEKYVEIDFTRIVMSKVRILKSKRALFDKLTNPLLGANRPSPESAAVDMMAPPPPPPPPQPTHSAEFKQPMFTLPKLPAPQTSSSASEINTNGFHLISCDLRNLNELDKKLKECELNFSLPTLFISECVLIYMSAEHSSQLLSYLTRTFDACCCLVNYEQVNLNDKFGEIMLANMELRSCRLLGVEACHSIDSQFNRFVRTGFSSNVCQVLTMTDFYRHKLDRRERERIESIEFLDESELLYQLMDHYCICIASNNDNFKEILM